MRKIILATFLNFFLLNAAFAEGEEKFQTTITQRWVINPRFTEEGLNAAIETTLQAIREDSVLKEVQNCQPALELTSTDQESTISVIAECLCFRERKEDLAECLNEQIPLWSGWEWIDPRYVFKEGLEGVENPNDLFLDPMTGDILLNQLLLESPGEPYLIRNDLQVFPTGVGTSEPLSFFFMGHWADCQLIDEVSPARLGPYDNIVSASHEPAEDTALYACASLVDTMNQFMEHTDRTFDILPHTGDLIDTGEEIELMWAIQLIQGGTIEPCTGLMDPKEPSKGCIDRDAWMKKELHKFQWTEGSDEPFFAPGLDPNANVPVYYLFGNHDGLVTGNFPSSDNPEGGSSEFHDDETVNHLFGHQIGSFATSPEHCDASAFGHSYDEVIAQGYNFVGFEPLDLTAGNVVRFFGTLNQCIKQKTPDFTLNDIEIPQFEDASEEVTNLLNTIQGFIDLASNESLVDSVIEEPGEEIGLKKINVGQDPRRVLIGSKTSLTLKDYDLKQRERTIAIHFEEFGESNAGGFIHSLVYTKDTQQLVLGESGEPMRCNTEIAKGEDPNLACSGFYAFDCLEDNRLNNDFIPLRCIALDSLGNGASLWEGTATTLMADFLAEELEKARTEKKLVLAFSHHGPESYLSNNLTDALDIPKSDFPEEGCKKDGCALVRFFQRYDNFVAWIYGHGHRNVITAWPSPDPTKPEFGFWAIQTAAAGINWPQVARALELVDFRNGVGAIFATMIEHHSAKPYYETIIIDKVSGSTEINRFGFDGSDLELRGSQLAYQSRLVSAWDALMGEHVAFAYGKKDPDDKSEEKAVQILTVTDSSRTQLSQEGTPSDRNVVLLFQIPSDIAEELAQITNDKLLTYSELDPNIQATLDNYSFPAPPEPGPQEPGSEEPTAGSSEEEGCGCQVIGGSGGSFGIGSIVPILLIFIIWFTVRRKKEQPSM